MIVVHLFRRTLVSILGSDQVGSSSRGVSVSLAKFSALSVVYSAIDSCETVDPTIYVD